MLNVIGRRLVMSVILILVVSLFVFFLQSLVPGSAASYLFGGEASDEQLAHFTELYGLDKPWYERYWDWLSAVFQGDLGTSFFTGEPVSKALNARLAVSVSVVIVALIFSCTVGISLGLISAIRGGFVGRAIDVVSLVGYALPSFWVAAMLNRLLTVEFRWFPSTGYVPFSDSPFEWLRSILLPATALGLFGVATITKQTRNAALDVLDSDYVRMLRANGVSESHLIFKHVLRNSSIPVVTSLGVLGAALIGGTVFVEAVFALPGLGSQAVAATSSHDLAIILGVGLYFTVWVAMINLLVDLAYGVINPKVREW